MTKSPDEAVYWEPVKVFGTLHGGEKSSSIVIASMTTVQVEV